MELPMKNYQAIFQIQTPDGEWLDYVRNPVRRPDDAPTNMSLLAKQTGRKFRVSVEDWSDEFPRDPTIYYGDWDKSKLSPAAQDTGVFIPAA
jgi:hypothetical protein